MLGCSDREIRGKTYKLWSDPLVFGSERWFISWTGTERLICLECIRKYMGVPPPISTTSIQGLGFDLRVISLSLPYLRSQGQAPRLIDKRGRHEDGPGTRPQIIAVGRGHHPSDPRRMVEHTTVACDTAERKAIKQIQRLRGDSNTRQTVRWLVDNVDFEDKSHDCSDNYGIIVEEC